MLRIAILLTLVVILTIPVTGHANTGKLKGLGPQDQYFEEALELAGISAEQFRFDPHDIALWGGGRYRLSYFDLFFDKPWKISPYCRRTTDGVLERADNLPLLLFTAQSRTGSKVSNALSGDPLAEFFVVNENHGDLALAHVLGTISRYSAKEVAAFPSYAEIPTELRLEAALLLQAAVVAAEYREIALTKPLVSLGVNPQEAWELMYGHTLWHTEHGNSSGYESALMTEDIIAAIDYPVLYLGGNILAAAFSHTVAACQENLAGWSSGDFSFQLETDLGLVLLTSSAKTIGETTHRPAVLVMDFSPETHHNTGGGTMSFDQPISMLIDAVGDDIYTADVPAFGSGICGYGYMADLNGNDSYIVDNAALGFSALGMGILADFAGNDSYQGDSALLGSGWFGPAVFCDLAGSDMYHIYRAALGFGYTMGCGIAVDSSGDDTYRCDDTDIQYAWFDDYPHQLNMALGFGFGRRADAEDGHSWAGGIGIFVDGAGDDSYSCGIYGIGCSYWYGLGIFRDIAGDDNYSSYAYSIASPPHFTIGVFQDDSGNDRYVGGSSRACGFGRDFTIGWFEEGDGDDFYLCNDSAYGVGNVNGLGVCWDKAGNDIYIAYDNSFGTCFVESEGSLRDHIINCGLFVDGGGRDRYLQLPERLHDEFDYTLTLADITDFEAIECFGDGQRLSRSELLPQPGSTGGAVDSGNQ